jgi:hypothetical protein
MTRNNRFTGLTLCALVGVFILAESARSVCHAATFWTGPNTNWTKSGTTPSDVILPGKVVLTRGTMKVLYNTAAGETSAGVGSPKGTLWAFGSFSNHTAFQSLDSMRNGNLAARILNQDMVMWIITPPTVTITAPTNGATFAAPANVELAATATTATNDDIFVSVKFTTWGTHGVGTVSYTRSTSGGVVSDGATVTNVAFFDHRTNRLGSVTTPPFRFTASNLSTGAYALTAVATAAGLSRTSAVVNITVVQPLTLRSPSISGDLFSFSYNADSGKRYVVQRASMIDPGGLFDWVSVATNTASSNRVFFSENLTTNVARFYRVERLPSP